MFTEIAILGGASLLYLKWDELSIRRKWRQIMASGGWFTNKLGKSLKILEIDKTDYGFDIKIELPYSYTADDLEKDLPIIKEGLHFENIQTEAHDNICRMRCVTKKSFTDFKPYPLPPNKILIAEGLNYPVIIDMNEFPHVIIAGCTGSGKSRLLFCILANLIATTNQAEIHLLQRRKNDLEVFASCKQVKTVAKSLEEIRDCLKKLDLECQRREPLINPKDGIYSIADYNEKNKDKKLKYVYGVVEEFSTIQTSKSDSKAEKDLKNECLHYIKTIVNVGRSAGIFLITAIQKPTDSMIPSDIKDGFFTRASMRLKDDPPSIVILGNNKATKLKKRQVIVDTYDTVLGYTYTIGHDEIMANIKNSIIDKPKKVPKPKVNKTQERLAKLHEAD